MNSTIGRCVGREDAYTGSISASFIKAGFMEGRVADDKIPHPSSLSPVS